MKVENTASVVIKARPSLYCSRACCSSHLFQINAYMDNLEGDRADTCEMMLLYPTVDASLSADYSQKGHKIRIRTINLNQPWPSIHQDLLALVA